MRSCLQVLLFEPGFFSLLCPLLLSGIEACFGDQLNLPQRIVYAVVQKADNCSSVSKTHLHLGRMHVDIHLFGRHRQMQYGKREAVLHKIGAISFFQSCGQLFAAQHPAIDKEGLEASGGPADFGFPQKSIQDHVAFRIFGVHRDDGTRCLTSIDPVDQFPKISVSGGVEFVLAVHTIVERYQGM